MIGEWFMASQFAFGLVAASWLRGMNDFPMQYLPFAGRRRDRIARVADEKNEGGSQV